MDTLTPDQRSERMRRIKGRNTGPEMQVRRFVHGLGFRYRLHAKDLPGRPDLTFRRHKLAVFVHGCYWHRHPDPACKLARLPKSRLEFWTPKLERNRMRDLEVQAELKALGWQVLIIWECQISDRNRIETGLRTALGQHGFD